jgi:hypothetical protein
MSNFVVAKGIERLDEAGVERAIGECKAVSGGRGMISTSSGELSSGSKWC